MSNSTQELKAQQRREQFADLLREMFQLNQPELDFGLYRIMHARKDDINRFIEKDLPAITRKAFEQFASLDKTQLETELEKQIKNATELGVDPNGVPKVQELQAQLKDNFDLAREEGEVYDALVTFFNRYYSEGDFLSRRVYKDGTYAIPYQGEEVVLHWANKDQYYIKSSETLRDYSFRLSPNAGLGEDPLRVHFKLVDAEAGAKDNNKESADSKRVFVLDTDTPWQLIDGEVDAEGNSHQELQLRFMFRVATMEDWTESAQQSATAAAKKKPPTQDALRAIAVEQLLGEASELPEAWKTALATPYRKADGEKADYSILQGQLNNYTKKNTFDYFIHKDLGGFLTRELDFYMKNELLDWSDIASLKNDTARLAPLLSKIEVIRQLGEKIIAFLAQLENFQKKLWLKKKFVTETQYCITLDRIEQYENLLTAVFDNERQRQDWVDLYGLDIDRLQKDRCEVGSLAALIARPEYRYLMLDTQYFDQRFKNVLLASIEDIDSQIDGVLVNGENYQTCNLLMERYGRSADLVYLDPPYNTDATPILYKNGYKDSTWASLMLDRIKLANDMAGKNAPVAYAIDDVEVSLLKELIKYASPGREVLQCIVEHYPGSGTGRSNVSRTHEYCLFSVPEGMDVLRGESVEDGERYRGFRRAGTGDNNFRVGNPGRPESFFAVLVDKETFKVVGLESPPVVGDPYPLEDTKEGYKRVYPIGEDGSERVWSLSYEGAKSAIAEGRIISSERFVISRVYNDEARRLLLPSVWQGKAYNATTGGTNLLTDLFGRAGSFSYPKALGTMEKVIDASLHSRSESLVVDLFGGSGTTAHAMISYGRKYGGKNRYIISEMGSYYDSVLKARICKAAYSDSWEQGKPRSLDSGVSHFIKCIRLENYEDALGNLALDQQGQKSLLDSSEDARQAYIMNYMLDVETRGSQSLLNTEQFLDPTKYQLNVRSAGGDETKAIYVDLLETFNYLLGLRVEHIAAPIYFDSEFTQGEFGRWQATVKRAENGRWWFRTVYGKNAAGQSVLVVWRNLPAVIAGEENGLLQDNAVLDAVLIEKLNIRLTESPDDEIDLLYINGDHNIAIPRDRKGQPMEQARVQLIEEAFHRLMFADTESVQ